MTGIERLRKLSKDMLSLSLWVRLAIGTEKDWDCCQGDGRTLNDELLSIAGQIERERACDEDAIENVRLIVGGVIDDMEHHVSGVEGAEDSPVARWARELREALKSDTSDGRDAQKPSWHDHADAADVTSDAAKVTRDPAEDVSMSAYDLLPADEREAIAWVRDHGGIEAVKEEWNHSRNLKRSLETAQAKVERQQRHIEEIQAKLSERRDKINVMRAQIAELRKRAMPEGCEWDGSVLMIRTAENVDYDGETLFVLIGGRDE